MKFISRIIHNREVRQSAATVIVSTNMFSLGFIHGWLSPTIELLSSTDSPVALNSSQLSWIMSASFVGGMLGPIASYLLMDLAGRRGALMVLNTLPTAGWVLTFYAADFLSLFVARCLVGFWIGIGMALVPVYVSEIVDPGIRSSMNTLPICLHKGGILAVFVVGALVSYRTLSVIGFLFSFSNCFLLLLVPESPYFHTMKDNKEKAVRSMKWLFCKDDVGDDYKKLEKFIEASAQKKVSLTDSRNVKTMLIVVPLTLFLSAGGGCLTVVLPIIIPEKAFFSLTNEDCVIIIGVVNFVFSYRPKCMTVHGNKPVLIFCSCISSVSLAAMAFWHYFEKHNTYVRTTLHWVPFISYLVFINFNAIGVQPIVTAFRGELFPTELKALMSGLVTSVAIMGLFVTMKTFIPLQTMVGTYINFVIASVSCLCIAVITYFFVIETDKKSLEEIQKELNNSNKRRLKSNNKPFDRVNP